MLQLQPGRAWMIKAERDRCAELVEQIRVLAKRRPDESDAVDERHEAIRELCDQLVMKLQPITVRRLTGSR